MYDFIIWDPHLVTNTSRDGMSCPWAAASMFHRAVHVLLVSRAVSLEASVEVARCCSTAAIHVSGLRAPGQSVAR